MELPEWMRTATRQDKPVVNGTYELTVIRETDEIESLESGIDGLVILTVIDAYIDLINWFNNESYGGEPYYDNCNAGSTSMKSLNIITAKPTKNISNASLKTIWILMI